MPAQPSRLNLATRIHQLMLRELGQGIEVEQMLAHDRYARDVLLVCEALRGSELADLAGAFRHASAQFMGQWIPPGHVQQATDWSGDTSGFGVTKPPPRDVEPTDPMPLRPERRRGWLPWRRG